MQSINSRQMEGSLVRNSLDLDSVNTSLEHTTPAKQPHRDNLAMSRSFKKSIVDSNRGITFGQQKISASQSSSKNREEFEREVGARSLKIDCSGPVDVIPDDEEYQLSYRPKNYRNGQGRLSEVSSNSDHRSIKMDQIVGKTNCKDFFASKIKPLISCRLSRKVKSDSEKEELVVEDEDMSGPFEVVAFVCLATILVYVLLAIYCKPVREFTNEKVIKSVLPLLSKK